MSSRSKQSHFTAEFESETVIMGRRKEKIKKVFSQQGRDYLKWNGTMGIGSSFCILNSSTRGQINESVNCGSRVKCKKN